MVLYKTGIPIGMEGLTATPGANIKTMTQQLNQPAGGYSASSYGSSTTGTSGSTTSTSTGGTSTTTGVYGYTHTLTSTTSNPATSYSASRTTTTPTSTAPPQTVAPQSSTTVPQATETTPPTGVAHLWIGWKIEPWEEELIQKFIEAFEHGKHVHRPIELPPMGGVLAPIPGAPAPGAPVVTMQPQGAGNQQQLTV